MRKAYPFTFYFLYFAALACLAPFVVLFYQQLGFNGSQIGLLAGMAPLITLVARRCGRDSPMRHDATGSSWVSPSRAP